MNAPYMGWWGSEQGDTDVPITADKFLEKFLANASSIDMNVDGSVTPVNFTYTVPANDEAFISRCNIYIQDASPSPILFGGIAALTNGLLIEVLDSGLSVIKTFNAQKPTQDNSDFVSLAGVDVRYQSGAGAGDDVAIRWTFANHSGGDTLQLRQNETFRVRVRDNLTALTAFRWVLQGRSL
ncbi:hypothetical protein N9980_01980 [bacterium]|nr:hypothetical protein [bacterium]